MFLFLLGFVFQLNETSKETYFKHLRRIHTLLWLYRSDLPQLEVLKREWEHVEEDYATNQGILTAKVNCEEMADFCQDVAQGKTPPLVIHGHHSKHFPTRYTGEHAPLSRFMSRWSRTNPQSCRIFNPSEPKYPAFVFYSADPESACIKAMEFEQFSSFAAGNVYAGNETNKYNLVAYIRPNYTIPYRSSDSRVAQNSFIRGLLPVSLTKWRITSATQMRRRIGFVVCRNTDEIEPIREILLEKESEITFTILSAEEFRWAYPYIALNSWDYPAVAVANRKGKFLLVRAASPTNDHFKWVFKEAVAGKMDAKMREKLSMNGKRNSGWIRPVSENIKLYALLVVLTVGSAAGLLYIKVNRCVNNVGGRKPVAFEL